MKLRHTLAGAFAFTLAATGALALSLSLPSSPVLGPFTTIFTALLSSHVASMASVAGLYPGLKVVEVDGFAVAGDGGRRKVVYDPSNACGAGGHPAASTPTAPTTCVNSAYGGAPAGAWDIDWASVAYQAASPCLFESCPTASDDTAAITAAIATGRTVSLPALSTRSATNYRYFVTSDIPQRVSGQLIFGEGRVRSMIQVNSNTGFRTGVFVSTAPEPGPILRDFGIYFSQQDPTNSSPPVPIQFVPAVYAQNVPRWRSEHMGYYACWICIDMRGNDGGTTFEDTQMSDFKYGRWIDGSIDTVRIEDDHVFPLNISSQFYNNYILSYGLPGSYNQIHNYVGRVDDLKVIGGIYLAGQAFDVHRSTFNPNDTVGGTIVMTGTRFDVSPALTCSGYADITVTGTFGGSGGPGLTGFVNTACNLTLTGNYFQTNAPAGTATASGSSGSAVYNIGGQTTLSGNIYDIGSADSSTVVSAGGHLTMMGEKFNRNPNIAYPNTAVITLTGGDAILMGNSINSIGSGSGRFIAVTQDNAANRVIGNSSPGYPAYTPSNPAGTYLAN